MIGSGGVGDAAARIASERDFFESWIVSDYDLGRAQRTVDAVAARRPGESRFVAAQVDASSADAVAALAREHRATHVFNAVDPRFVMPIFNGAKAAGADYLDMAMSLSQPHPDEPYAKSGVKLGDEQFAAASDWEEAGRLALVGIGVEPGLSDVRRLRGRSPLQRDRRARDADGANLVVRDEHGNEIFAPSFSIWTTIEECLNPPVIWEKDRGWYTTEPFSGAEVFDFPDGIGEVECVNVEHEEVLLIPRWVNCKRSTFKYGLGDEFIDVLRTLHKLGLDRTDPVSVKGGSVSPRDVVAAASRPGDHRPPHGGQDAPACTSPAPAADAPGACTYHVVDNQTSMVEYGAQCVVWQTAAVVALSCSRQCGPVLRPEAFDAARFGPAAPARWLRPRGYGRALIS